jgi:hypothetical protein
MLNNGFRNCSNPCLHTYRMSMRIRRSKAAPRDISWRLSKSMSRSLASVRCSTAASNNLHSITFHSSQLDVRLGNSVKRNLGMITSSLRRAVRSHPPPQSISRPTTPSIAASFSSQSHQRRQSSSKPPIPPNDGPANVANPSPKTVGAPRSKDGTGEKRSGAESRLSRRKIPRDRSEYAADGKDEWAVNLPSVPSTQHLDPKGSNRCFSKLNFLSNVCLRYFCRILFLQP